MRDPSKRDGWLDKIPGWLKGAAGLIGTIAAFVIAFRNNWRLYITITILLVLVYVLGVSLVLLFKRRKPRSKKKGQRSLPPLAYRLLGLFGLFAVFLVFTGLILVRPTRQLALDGILGTPTPTSPPQLAAPDVLIAPFDSPAASSYQVEHWLQESLQQQLHDYDLDNITVQVGETPIGSESEAQATVNNTGSKVVIWGWYDNLGIQVKIFLSGGEQSGTLLPGTKVIPLESADVPDTNLSVVITEILPENVNFLSLFVIGHLEYLSNNYQLGYRAFDAAMAQMPPPEKVSIQNQAILHFFRARQMEHDGSAAQDIMCEYAKALELDPQFDVANNNLGLVISKGIAAYSSVGDRAIVEAGPCLEQAGLHEDILDLPPLLFERAANANPHFLIAKYNQYAYLWSRDWSLHSDPQLRSVMEDIQRQDPGIIGTYIVLAVSKDRQGDVEGAMQMYQAGIAVEPDLTFLHMNLGQLYLSTGKNETEAENEFLKTLQLDPKHKLARLALGHLYFRQRRFNDATAQFDQILLADERIYEVASVQLKALVLRSTISFAQDRPIQAIEDIQLAFEKPFPDDLLTFLLGLIYQYQGQNDLAADYFSQVAAGTGSAMHTQHEWENFKKQCFTEETSSMLFADWALTRFPSSNCLPSDPKERILAIYELLNDDLFALREEPQQIYIGAQCPYLYTEDPSTGEWEFETTILYKVIDHEAAQLRPLTEFTGRLLIREQEAEISHLNRLYVIAKMSDGSVRILQPDIQALKQADDDYVILHQGEEVLVTLNDYANTDDVSEWWVMAVGYYTPLRK